MRRLALPRGILSGKMTERGSEMTEAGSEMSDLVSAAPAAPSAPANNNPDVGDPTVVIDEELLIEEVKKYPILYENSYTDYMEKMAKTKDWNKVCQSLFKQWSEFSPRKKKVTIKIVQIKWQKQTDNFFKSYKGVQKHSTAKKSKTNMDSMMFLVPPTVASDVDESACASNTNTDAAQIHIADVMPMDMPLQQELEIPQVNIPDNPPVPSTSERVGEYARTCEFARTYEVHKPYYIPMTDIGLTAQTNPNPNMHFALMLIPLLNRLNQNALYNAWPEILNTIKNAECPKSLEILQQELVYDPAVKTQENVEFSGVSTAKVPPEEEEAVQENPIYPSSYGRPTNPDGEIMYPETDHEDLDEG